MMHVSLNHENFLERERVLRGVLKSERERDTVSNSRMTDEIRKLYRKRDIDI